jgi:NAD(P)-dependent dehydrogenase (short-subunit alcohol dehydrogenase family)
VLEAGRTAVLVPADLTHEDACRALVDRAVQEFGRIDILVNNAAHQMAQLGGIADITTEQFDRVLKANLYAMFWFCKMALPHMHAGASTINTSSVQPSSPSPELLGVGQHGETAQPYDGGGRSDELHAEHVDPVLDPARFPPTGAG